MVLPQNIIGQVTLPVTLDHLNTHKFTAVCHLTVYCLLDADCLEMHNARQFIKILAQIAASLNKIQIQR